MGGELPAGCPACGALPCDWVQPPAIWQKPATAPTDRSVLVLMREGVGSVMDVAMFIGRQPDGTLKWIMADVSLVASQITHWCELPAPPGDA